MANSDKRFIYTDDDGSLRIVVPADRDWETQKIVGL